MRPGKPWQNGKEERFNGTVRDECLNMHSFKTVAEAWLRLSAFRQEYNTFRPHSSLGDLAPQMFKTAWLEAKAKWVVSSGFRHGEYTGRSAVSRKPRGQDDDDCRGESSG